MKIKKNIYQIIIIFLLSLLVFGYLINKKNSSSKKNEISNLNKQILTKTQQLYNIQKNLIKNKENLNDILSLNNINFLKIISDKKIKNFKGYKLNKYRTNEILSSGNYRALASAYIDFYNEDKEII